MMDEFGNVYSQFGEDKVLAEMLERLGDKYQLDKWACEFGAWDGLYLSNTANLIINSNYRAVLIESDATRFETLKENMVSHPVIIMNSSVQLDGENTLDNLLSQTIIPKNLDLMSIDIDGADYWVFEGLKLYRPKIIVIEFNPTIPKEIRFTNPRDVYSNKGSSIRSICELAESKNYKLCGLTTCNLIFIDDQYHELFEPQVIKLENLPDPEYVNRIWQTFDGEIHIEPQIKLLWHQINVPSLKLQIVPKVFRHFPDSMGSIRFTLFKLWKTILEKRKFDEQ
jgi:hypothetical protein